ncbi:MAG: prepilin-type N-terminal cleavage/methylation domain-containing protein [Candidatus Omnitrophica bacterium]|nr:prepilin-type N-terminal cleavage/methylation domain-containing protein [Candidatus Omnitrophota bacterium]
MKRNSGFSLVEMVIVAAIFALMMGVVFASATAGSKSMDIHQARISATQEARRGLDEMARELIRAPTAEIADETGETAWPAAGEWTGIQFRYPEGVDDDGEVDDWSAVITYSLDGDQLMRTDDAGSSRVLANGVTDFVIQQGDTQDEIWIQLTTEKTSRSNHVMQQPLQMRIRVRNE